MNGQDHLLPHTLRNRSRVIYVALFDPQRPYSFIRAGPQTTGSSEHVEMEEKMFSTKATTVNKGKKGQSMLRVSQT